MKVKKNHRRTRPCTVGLAFKWMRTRATTRATREANQSKLKKDNSADGRKGKKFQVND